MYTELERIWMGAVAIISHSSSFQNFLKMIQECHEKSQTVLRVAQRCNYGLRSPRLWHCVVGQDVLDFWGGTLFLFFSRVKPTKNSTPENGGSMFLRNFPHHPANDAASYARRPKSSTSGHPAFRSKSNPLLPQYSWKRYRWSTLMLW
jgi:hypothetical protein